MFGWISRCWGGMGIKSSFEKARMRSVMADWQVPDDADVCVLISSFKGTNPQIQPETAFNIFLSHLEMSEQKSNSLFLLKHLYILDHTVEEGVVLQQISAYYCSEFFIFQQGSNIEFNPLRELVATYFLYIKKKAEVYHLFEPKYFEIKKSERQDIVQGLSFSEIFSLIDKCLDVQKGIDLMNSKYKSHDKSKAIIQMVFTMLLKSYLFAYTLVSLAATTLFSRMKKLNKAQVVRFYKFIKYYNKQYTHSLYDFIESNKQIYQFKSMKYSEIILIDRCYIDYLENYLHNMENQPLGLDGPDIIDYEEENRVQNLPADINPDQLQSMVVTYHYKKRFEVKPAQQKLEQKFYLFDNFFSDAYESQAETAKRGEYNDRQAVDPSNDARKSSDKAEGALTVSKRLSFQKGLGESGYREQVWRSYYNVYSS